MYSTIICYMIWFDILLYYINYINVYYIILYYIIWYYIILHYILLHLGFSSTTPSPILHTNRSSGQRWLGNAAACAGWQCWNPSCSPAWDAWPSQAGWPSQMTALPCREWQAGLHPLQEINNRFQTPAFVGTWQGYQSSHLPGWAGLDHSVFGIPVGCQSTWWWLPSESWGPSHPRLFSTHHGSPLVVQ